MAKEPIINCHTHIFTGDHVPPFLAKTYIPAPFYFLLPLTPLVRFFRWWYKMRSAVRFSTSKKKWVKKRTALTSFFTRLHPLNILGGYYIFFFAFFLLYELLLPLFPPEASGLSKVIHQLYEFTGPIFPDIRFTWLKLLIIIIVFLFFDTIRNFIIQFAAIFWKLLKFLPGKQTKEMFGRYMNIGRYAFHKEQKTILSKLKSQYPGNTRFVILPMDMDYMSAGNAPIRYRDQMKELAEVKKMPSNKNLLFPFVFADPRRMVPVREEIRYKEGDKEYFTWWIQDGKVKLGDCFLREYLEELRFSGIKIYPALGYYPFDPKLLPLWKYAAENKIPILTHCIRGTIFYRGIKKQEWNAHPLYKQAMLINSKNVSDGFRDDEDLENEQSTEYIPLVLSQSKNVDFSYNFTHPMNYLCILEEKLLRKIITNETIKDPGTPLVELFGYNGPDFPMKNDLNDLKICLAHYGGEDEWKRFFEKDRYSYSSQLAKYPDTGIRFFETVSKKPAEGKPEQIWRHTDWYSIICSMMLQYPNVYADISYILHGDQEILPLLIQTLQNPGLKEKVLFGTDFFVVRNHKSDKNMLADMTSSLSETEFDQIARINPRNYLNIV